MEVKIKKEILLKDLNDNIIDIDKYLGQNIQNYSIDEKAIDSINKNVSLKYKKQDKKSRTDRTTLIYIAIIILLICTILFTFLYLKTDYISTQNFTIFFIGILIIAFMMEFVFKI